MRIQFGECTFDAVRRQVRHGTEAAHLSPRAFDLLELLIARRPRAISKDALLGALWPRSFVTEANLAGLVAEIRRVVCDDAREPRFLRTVHGFGYAFSDGAAPAADEDSVFRLVWGSREVPLAEGENLLGRDPAGAVSIDDATVSRHHARIVIDAGRAQLEDLGSKNGTWLGGRRIASPERLADADAIRVGPAALTFRSFAATGSTATERG
ncbi:MAG TPA: FHA domain-containing protein [Thermoanaerobaculia bacterium]